jgi:hypothetical protein
MRKPKLESAILADLESLDVSSVRALVASSSDGYGGTGGGTPIRLPNSVATREELLAWIRWRTERVERRDSLRFWLTFLAALAAAIVSFIAWRFPIPTGQ